MEGVTAVVDPGGSLDYLRSVLLIIGRSRMNGGRLMQAAEAYATGSL